MPKDANSKEAQQLKYEGLAALIIQGQEHAKERHDDFKEYVSVQFDDLKAHNKKQNGSIGEAIKDIGTLKRESNEKTAIQDDRDKRAKRRVRIIGIAGGVLALILSAKKILDLIHDIPL